MIGLLYEDAGIETEKRLSWGLNLGNQSIEKHFQLLNSREEILK